jgi:hypothetical protein
MAATVAASKTYDLSGGALREDLESIIWDISPQDTYMISTVDKVAVKSTVHEWLTDVLTSPSSTNAAIEGDAFAASARTLPSRLKNQTQISRKEFAVTGTAQKVDNAGMKELLGYHTARAGKEIKRDVESSFLSANTYTVGSSVSARLAAGAECFIYTRNHLAMQTGATTTQTSATTVAPASGVPGAVTKGSATAITEVTMKLGLQQAWSCGGEVGVLLCGPSLYNSISNFTGLATRFRDVSSRSQAQIIGAADVYVSAFGSHTIKLSRYCQTDTLLGLDMSAWAFGTLRPFQTVDIAKVSDEERRMLLVEWTVICRTPTANFKITAAT